MACAIDVPVLGIFLKQDNVIKWAPDNNLYKSDILSGHITAENIINKFYELVNNG